MLQQLRSKEQQIKFDIIKFKNCLIGRFQFISYFITRGWTFVILSPTTQIFWLRRRSTGNRYGSPDKRLQT